MIAPVDDFPTEFERQVTQAFGPGGLLARSKDFEYRPQQQTMATAVARACQSRTHLLVEAGTGVGKSLAYLVPSVLHALAENRKALISTHTINLQEQLFYKDIPLVQKLVPQEFKAVLLKGRQNYLCPRRLERAMSHGGELFASREQDELKRIWEWRQRTHDGTLSDLDPAPDPQVWLQVCSEAHVCTARTCGLGTDCFYQQARKEAEAAKVLVLNHSLFFNFLAGSEAVLEERGYLFHNDFIIFDEAHTLESVAARHLGLEISHGSLRYLLHRLFHPRTQKGIVAALRSGEAMKLVQQAEDEADLFFDKLERSSSNTRRSCACVSPTSRPTRSTFPSPGFTATWPMPRGRSRTTSSRPRCKRPRDAWKACGSASASSSARRARTTSTGWNGTTSGRRN
jgi:ATP-dependent DNA helicase DinG